MTTAATAKLPGDVARVLAGLVSLGGVANLRRLAHLGTSECVVRRGAAVLLRQHFATGVRPGAVLAGRTLAGRVALTDAGWQLARGCAATPDAIPAGRKSDA